MAQLTEQQVVKLAELFRSALSRHELERLIRVQFGDGVFDRFVSDKMPLAEAAFASWAATPM